jgi:hypothetical protein
MSMSSPSAPALSGPPAEHRGWLRRMFLWSAGLALVLLAGTWCAANWTRFHLIYCQRALLASKSEQRQQEGLALIEKYHVRPGMSLEAVSRVIRPLEMSEHKVPNYPPREGRSPDTIRSYAVYCPSTGGYPGPMLDFDENGCLAASVWLK